MNSTVKPMFLHGALVAIGLVAGTFANHLSGIGAETESVSAPMAAGEGEQSSVQAIQVSRATTVVDSNRRESHFATENADVIARHTS